MEPPEVKFELVDGNKITFDSQNFLANEMLDDIYVVTNQMDIDYELEGKSIDDAWKLRFLNWKRSICIILISSII